MECIRLKTKQEFEDVMKGRNKSWGLYMWDTFRENTCYIPEYNCFVSLNRAIELKFNILDYEKES